MAGVLGLEMDLTWDVFELTEKLKRKAYALFCFVASTLFGRDYIIQHTPPRQPQSSVYHAKMASSEVLPHTDSSPFVVFDPVKRTSGSQDALARAISDERRLSGVPPVHAVKDDIGRRSKMEDRYYVHTNFMDIPLQLSMMEEMIPSGLKETKAALRPSRALSKDCSLNRSKSFDISCLEEAGLVLDTFHLYSVFDGHGGTSAAEFCVENLHKFLTESLGKYLMHCPHPRQFLRLQSVPAGLSVQTSSVSASLNVEDSLELSQISLLEPEAKLPDIGTADDGELPSSASEPPPEFSLGRAEFNISAPSALEETFWDFMNDDGCCSPTDGLVCKPKRGKKKPPSRATSCAEPRYNGVSARELEAGLMEGLQNLDKKYGQMHTDAQNVGTTACIALLSRTTICLANIGDSRAVLYRNGKSMAVTRDHVPMCEDEANRIVSKGGRIVDVKVPRVMGVLTMTRAIGDCTLRPFVIPEAEVTILARNSMDEYLVVGTDGLWGEMTMEDVCDSVNKCLAHGKKKNLSRQASFKLASRVLVRRALEKGGSDNVTVIVIDLKPTDETP